MIVLFGIWFQRSQRSIIRGVGISFALVQFYYFPLSLPFKRTLNSPITIHKAGRFFPSMGEFDSGAERKGFGL